MKEIPDSFWSLFRSGNREIYMESLLRINEEYEYSNYYLSREVCIQILNEYFSQRNVSFLRDEYEVDLDALEPMATRVLNRLVNTEWLRKVEDYVTRTTNIVIPDYAAIMIEAFEKLAIDEEDVTQVYIQNIYAILFSLKNDARAGISLLDAALINTRKLNKALQDMLHNMDKFFGSLLEQKGYGELLQEHLEGYVKEVVKKKYHILKTSDNFYIYKADIKRWLGQMREDGEWIAGLCARSLRGQNPGQSGSRKPEVDESTILEKLDWIDRGFDDIEHRIANMDKEHSRYVRATVFRLNYLLNEDDDMKGLVIRLLNRLAADEDKENKITAVGARMNLSQLDILSNQSLSKRRKRRAGFEEGLTEDEVTEELTREDLDDFIFKIRNAIKEAIARKDELNKVISKLDFGKDKYQFLIGRNKGAYGLYYDMFTDDSLEVNPAQLNNNIDCQMNMFSMEHENQYGELMNELIHVFIPPENATQEQMEEAKRNMDKFADYRTYLFFDMQQLIKTEDGVMKIDLSKMIRKNSGGEGQNPLYVALLASFAQAYRLNLTPKLQRKPTIRLVVLDEAFSKMDSEKVASCIELIRGLGFQALISATNDKIQNYLENVDKTFVFANPSKKCISIQEFEKTEFAVLSQETEENE